MAHAKFCALMTLLAFTGAGNLIMQKATIFCLSWCLKGKFLTCCSKLMPFWCRRVPMPVLQLTRITNSRVQFRNRQRRTPEKMCQFTPLVRCRTSSTVFGNRTSLRMSWRTLPVSVRTRITAFLEIGNQIQGIICQVPSFPSFHWY